MSLGIVTRCPLVLRLKKLVGGFAKWKGTVSYLGTELELQDASQVEDEIRKGECPWSPTHRLWAACPEPGVPSLLHSAPRSTTRPFTSC